VRKRVLYVISGRWSFVEIDRAILAERWQVEEWHQPGRVPKLLALPGAVLRADLGFAWFASWHSFLPVLLARLLRKPVVLIVGGFDTADMPWIGYGYQQGGLRKWASGLIMRRATRLVTNSHYSREEIVRNTGIAREAVTVIHHGIPDEFGPLADEAGRERVALTVGHLAEETLEQKGHRPFVDAAALMPDVRFVFIGRWLDDSIEALRDRAGENVVFTGFVSDEERDAWYRRAWCYVQASHHEGFGMAVAEAMLAGCIPVVVDTTAMPEVVGDTGVLIESPEPEAISRGVAQALELGPEARAAARERVLAEFPVDARRRGIQQVVEEALRRE
jgi:glycosyltransferase involved in cell wall biosynthesis